MYRVRPAPLPATGSKQVGEHFIQMLSAARFPVHRIHPNSAYAKNDPAARKLIGRHAGSVAFTPSTSASSYESQCVPNGTGRPRRFSQSDRVSLGVHDQTVGTPIPQFAVVAKPRLGNLRNTLTHFLWAENAKVPDNDTHRWVSPRDRALFHSSHVVLVLM